MGDHDGRDMQGRYVAYMAATVTSRPLLVMTMCQLIRSPHGGGAACPWCKGGDCQNASAHACADIALALGASYEQS